MTAPTHASSASRAGTPPAASFSYPPNAEQAPSTQFCHLPDETIAIIGTKLRKPSDAFHFLLSCRQVRESGFFESCAPRLIASRVDALKNVDKQNRAAAAAQLAMGLKQRPGPIYLECILDKIDIPDESDLLFLLHRERKYVAAAVLAQAKRKELIEAAGKELGAHHWEHDPDGIRHFLNGVRESLAGNERLICRCYVGLWQWHSMNERDDRLVVDFAQELLRALAPAQKFVKLSVIMSMLESARMAPQWAKPTGLMAALHKVAKELPRPKGKRAERLFDGLAKAFGGCSDKLILARQLELFSPLLAQAAGARRRAGIAWLAQTIAQASKAGLACEEIRDLVPRGLFPEKARTYVIDSAIAGNFSPEVLRSIEQS
jgi:hypothetical protein